MSVLKFFRKRRKRKPESLDTELYDDGIPEDVPTFVRHGSLRRSERSDRTFIRNGNGRGSLDNYKSLLYLNATQQQHLKMLRQENEFQRQRANMLESQLQSKSSKNTPALLHKADSNNTEQETFAKRLVIDEDVYIGLQAEKDKYKDRFAHAEEMLKEQCKRSNSTEKQLVELMEHISKSNMSSEFKEDVKHVLKSLSVDQKHQSKLISTISERTLEIQKNIQNLATLVQIEPQTNSATEYKALPEGVKSAIQRLSKLIGPRWPELIPALGIPPDYAELRDKSMTETEIFWRIMKYWYSSGNDVTLTTLDSACRKININLFEDKPMPLNHRCIIQKKTHELQSDIIDVHHIIPYLQKYVPMSPYLIEYVYAPVMRSDRIRRLLDSLVTVGEKALPVFIKALSESKHGHLADSLQECLDGTRPNSTTKDREMSVKEDHDTLQTSLGRDMHALLQNFTPNEFASMKTKIELMYSNHLANENRPQLK